MRKHFLILMLFALLPLAGWAQAPVNLSGYQIKFGDPTEDFEFAYYSENVQKQAVNKRPAITLKKDASEISEADDKFNVVWTKNGETVEELKTVGEYVVTVTANGSDTYGSMAQSSRSFWVLRANNEVTNAPAVLVGPVTYAAAPSAGYELVATKPTVNFGTVKYLVTETDATPLATATEWSTTAPKSKKVGTHYVWFKVDGNENYKPIAPQKVGTGSVTITGGDLVENTDYRVPTALAVAGIPFNNTDQNLVAAGAEALTNKVTAIKYSLNGTDWQDAIPTGKNANTYTVYWKAVAADGYYDATGSVTAKINAVAPTITPATKVADATYTGEAQALLSAAGSATLGATPVYTIEYRQNTTDGWGAPSSDITTGYANVKSLDAGYYRVTTKVNEAGNYLAASGTTEVQIKKAKLTVTADAKSKVYSTVADPPLTATYTGWKKNETAANQVTAGKFTLATWTRDPGDAAGEYAITINALPTARNYYFEYNTANYGKFTITPYELDLDPAHFTFTLANDSKEYTGEPLTTTVASAKFNVPTTPVTMVFPTDYTYIITDNTNAGTANVIITGQGNFKGSIVKPFTITRKPVYLQPNNAAKLYKEGDPTYLLDDTDENWTAATTENYKLGTLSGSDFTEDEDAVLNGTVKLARVAGENVGTYKIYVKSYTPADDDNYMIAGDQVVNDPDDATVKNLLGTFQINPKGDGLVLRFKEGTTNSKIYGDADPDLDIDDLEYVSGAIGKDDWEIIKPTLSVPTIAPVSQKVADNATNKLKVTGLASTNYPVVTVQDYAFRIDPRPIAVIVKAQAIEYADETFVTDSDEDTYWVTDDANSRGNDWNGNQDTDTKAALNLTLSTIKALDSYGPNGDLAKTYENVIIAAIDNANYELTEAKCTWGNLTVSPSAYLVLSDANDDVFTQITAHNGQTKNVKIKFNRDQHLESDGDGVDRTWMKEKWNSIVLPFEISIAELSSKFGYAIFNVADAANTEAGKVAFKIEMAANYDGNIIPANTPLLIKTNVAVADATTITFGPKEIVAPATPQFGDAINATGYKFRGTYAPMTVSKTSEYADNFYFWTGTTDKPSRIKSDSQYDNVWVIKPFSAYVDQSAASAAHGTELEFTYEDLNGQTTTVKGISIDDINSDKLNEGIYNLNGVKMNNVPTQKGIYIMNGKKVVVK